MILRDRICVFYRNSGDILQRQHTHTIMPFSKTEIGKTHIHTHTNTRPRGRQTDYRRITDIQGCGDILLQLLLLCLCFICVPGAFLLPYMLFLTILCAPCLFLIMSYSQFCGRGPAKNYDFCPLMKGMCVSVLNYWTIELFFSHYIFVTYIESLFQIYLIEKEGMHFLLCPLDGQSYDLFLVWKLRMRLNFYFACLRFRYRARMLNLDLVRRNILQCYPVLGSLLPRLLLQITVAMEFL